MDALFKKAVSRSQSEHAFGSVLSPADGAVVLPRNGKVN